jgi:hypothetical protein
MTGLQSTWSPLGPSTDFWSNMPIRPNQWASCVEKRPWPCLSWPAMNFPWWALAHACRVSRRDLVPSGASRYGPSEADWPKTHHVSWRTFVQDLSCIVMTARTQCFLAYMGLNPKFWISMFLPIVLHHRIPLLSKKSQKCVGPLVWGWSYPNTSASFT